MSGPSPRDFVQNALDFAFENHSERPFTQSDIDYVLSDTRERHIEGTLPTLRREARS